MAPFFSIIVPTFNRALMLSRAIQSVLDQTYTDWELIIVDDGSTDHTKEVVSAYQDTRIKYFYQENKERSAARNKGIGLAHGTYITFLDSDDYYLPERLSKLFEEIQKRKAPVAFFYTGISFENEGVIEKRQDLPNDFIDAKDYLFYTVIGTPQACLHRAVFKKNKFNEAFHIAEDHELWLRVIDDGYSPIFIDQHDIIAVHHSDRSVFEFGDSSSFYEMLKVLKFIFKKPHPGEKVSRKSKRFVWSGVYFGIARFNIHKKNRWNAIYFLLKSIMMLPWYAQTKHKLFLIYRSVLTKKGNLDQLNKLSK